MFTAKHDHSHSKRKNLLPPIQMQLPEKLKTFSQILIAFLESILKFKHFEKKKQLHCSRISKDVDPKRRVFLNA